MEHEFVADAASGQERRRKINPDEMRKIFDAANENRDYTIYTRAMDAALEAKANSLFHHFNVNEGDIIVDAGSGTGKLAELAAKEFRGAKVYALDISHELQERADENRALTHLVYGNAKEQNFPDNSLNIKYYSTVGHEIESFDSEGAMRTALENSLKELAPGGTLLIRDFAKPSGTEPIYMKILSGVGGDTPPPETPTAEIDYNSLSARALLELFRREFRGGGAFQYKTAAINGGEYIEISPEWAHEFYLRKDYTANWRQEIKEKYTYWTTEEAERVLEEMGFVNVRVIPDPNEYIIKNRLKGKIELYEVKDGQLKPIPIPATHMVIVAEKPKTAVSKSPTAAEQELPMIDYEKLLSSINFDEKRMTVHIGDKEFSVAPKPLVGTKKNILTLEGGKTVLKTARSNTHNSHGVFKSFFQIIERQNILEEAQTPHLKILEADPEGPPYRFVIQEALPKNSRSAADLIMSGELTEKDIKQMAEIVNKYELDKTWQLDTNPSSWFRVTNEDGSTQMIYVSGKVYRYDEQWEFKKIGLLQWTFREFVKNAQNYSAAIPTEKMRQNFLKEWRKDSEIISWWKKYLHPSLWP